MGAAHLVLQVSLLILVQLTQQKLNFGGEYNPDDITTFVGYTEHFVLFVDGDDGGGFRAGGEGPEEMESEGKKWVKVLNLQVGMSVEEWARVHLFLFTQQL